MPETAEKKAARRIAAIVAGEENDPFSFLGMHKAGGRLMVRAFLPGAAKISVVHVQSGESAGVLKQAHKDGVFRGAVGKGAPFAYRLRVEDGAGERTIADPYSFPTIFGPLDLYLHAEGSYLKSYEKMGAHPMKLDGVAGTSFAVWAPNARRVSVVGPFNDWDGRRHVMRRHPGAGLWEIFLPDVQPSMLYKFEIKAKNGDILLKADPYAFEAERPPNTASVVWGLPHGQKPAPGPSGARDAPVSIYEVHLGSWRRKEGNRSLTYRELADTLIPYAKDMGFTHLELMPVSEHPFEGSWGYQPTGLYAPISRFGTPDDFREFIARAHDEGIGVILDWVPGHFPNDRHGLGRFDGTHLYEHSDPREGYHPDWNTLIYNYGRREVCNFLISNALYWLDQYGADGLRVDAVASMLYRNYSRKEGEWVPNIHGGVENLEAIDFLRRMNELCYREHPKTMTVAEESTAWPMVSRPVYLGGLGFGYKWNMGWMHDTLEYISKEPVHRKFHHDKLTFGLTYAFSENFILPLSHDEVVHGKGSLLGKMPGDRWQKFANLRAYLAFQFTQPGKKLLFMGSEFGQEREWNHDASLDWHLTGDALHGGLQKLVRDLNGLYRGASALHERDCEADGFAWIDCNDSDDSVISYIRRAADPEDFVAVVCNFTPVVREAYRIGVPVNARYRECLNTDSEIYGGSGAGNLGGVDAEPTPAHGHSFSLSLRLPPLSVLVLRPEAQTAKINPPA